jgi:ferric-dicitrate binding protein FerR (iron transport regulator)
VRIDQSSQLAFASGEEASLLEGAAYVDSGATTSPGAAAFALHTAAGTVRHLGTQYEARIDGTRLRVAIREGKVLIDSPGGSVSGVAGEQILLDGGRISRSDLPAHDVSWNWLGMVTPAYSIDGASLADFLHWAARETGRELVFADAETELAASRIILRGSVQGLSPDESIVAVGATTGLAIDVAAERIEVRPAAR